MNAQQKKWHSRLVKLIHDNFITEETLEELKEMPLRKLIKLLITLIETEA